MWGGKERGGGGGGGGEGGGGGGEEAGGGCKPHLRISRVRKGTYTYPLLIFLQGFFNVEYLVYE